MSVTKLVKSTQDIMRQDAGVDGDAQRIAQLGWMLFLKIFSDKEKSYKLADELAGKNYKPPIPKKYLWDNWASNPEGITGEALLDFVDTLFRSLKNISASPESNPRGVIAREVFRDSDTYMKSGILLRQVINKINQIDFNKQKDLHIFGDIYENFLKDLQSTRDTGEFYTPRPVTQFVTEMINPKLGEKVLDPACGTGGFLACAIEHINRKGQVNTAKDRKTLQKQIFGVEKKQTPHLLCITNMLLHDIEVPTQIIRANSLTKRFADYEARDKVDIILTNPPFGGAEEDSIKANFPKSFQTSETADLFLVLIMHLLRDGGRAGIVLPNGSLFTKGATERIRQELTETCNLHTTVRLPEGVFAPYSSIQTNLLFFEKGIPTKDIWYYELPLPKSLKKYNKGNPIKHEEFEPVKKWWKKRVTNEFAWKVNIKDIANNDYNLDIKNPHIHQENFGDPKILEKDYLSTKKESSKLINEIKDLIEESLIG